MSTSAIDLTPAGLVPGAGHLTLASETPASGAGHVTLGGETLVPGADDVPLAGATLAPGADGMALPGSAEAGSDPYTINDYLQIG